MHFSTDTETPRLANTPLRNCAMKIRVYEKKDEQELIELWKTCHLVVPWNDPEKDIQRKLDENPELLFVGLKKDKIISSCMAGYDGHRGWIYYLAVLPAYRNQNYARQIVHHAENVLEKMGCPKINLMVRDTNTSVIEFYKAVGYHDDPVVVLSRRLKNDPG